MSVATSFKSVYLPSSLPPSLELWSFLVMVWFGSLLASSSLDCRKFLPRVLGGRLSLFGPRPSGLNFIPFLILVFSFCHGV